MGQEHQRIFDTIYKDTKLKIEIRQIRFLRSDVAIIHTKANVVKKDDAFPTVAGAFPSLVLSKDGGKWQIVAFQNTANAEIEANRK
ncbi:MAG: SgcJ/EcaC family oxidoreductase [Pyrinomonadaceae bacterium]